MAAAGLLLLGGEAIGLEAVGAALLGPAGMVIGAAVIIAVGSYECYQAYEKSKTQLSDSDKAEPCADCGEVGCFEVPPGADPEEFKRQLQEQQDALNRKSPDEILRNLDKFDKDGRPNDSSERSKARRDASRQAYDKAYDKAISEGKNAAEADQAAQQAADDAVAGKDATHEIDWVAGGDGTISGMGDSKVNRSIGSQWNQNAPGSSISRREALRKAAEAAKAAGKEKMEVKLQAC